MIVLIKDPAKPLMPPDVQVGDLVRISDRRRQWTQRTGVRDALVGPVVVVEGLEFAQDAQEVVLVPDQGAVEELTAAGQGDDSAFRAERFNGAVRE